MLAKVRIQMRDGRQTKTTTTRAALAAFFARRQNEIRWLIADINLIRWFYDATTGWSKRAKFRYVPNRPDLWRIDVGIPKPTNQTPFDYV